jgi:hypothetical protein
MMLLYRVVSAKRKEKLRVGQPTPPVPIEKNNQKSTINMKSSHLIQVIVLARHATRPARDDGGARLAGGLGDGGTGGVGETLSGAGIEEAIRTLLDGEDGTGVGGETDVLDWVGGADGIGEREAGEGMHYGWWAMLWAGGGRGGGGRSEEGRLDEQFTLAESGLCGHEFQRFQRAFLDI